MSVNRSSSRPRSFMRHWIGSWRNSSLWCVLILVAATRVLRSWHTLNLPLAGTVLFVQPDAFAFLKPVRKVEAPDYETGVSELLLFWRSQPLQMLNVGCSDTTSHGSWDNAKTRQESQVSKQAALRHRPESHLEQLSTIQLGPRKRPFGSAQPFYGSLRLNSYPRHIHYEDAPIACRKWLITWSSESPT